MMNPEDIRVTPYLPQSGYGAGGMTVGISTSGIIVHHIPSGIGVSCDSERSQHANKEKALQMVQSLVLAIESEKRFTSLCPEEILPGWDVETTPGYYTVKHTDNRPQQLPPPTPYVADKVTMIKEVRRKAESGLKEAKEAVDKYWGCPDCEALAISHLLTENPPAITASECASIFL